MFLGPLLVRNYFVFEMCLGPLLIRTYFLFRSKVMVLKIQVRERQQFQCTQPEYGCIGQFSNNHIHFSSETSWRTFRGSWGVAISQMRLDLTWRICSFPHSAMVFSRRSSQAKSGDQRETIYEAWKSPSSILSITWKTNNGI